MFKDVFVLKRDAWHAKLMKYCLGLRPRDFTHMCPYFWITVLNIIICPIIFIGRNIIVAWNAIGNIIDTKFTVISNKIEQRSEGLIAKIKNQPNIRELLIKTDFTKGKCGKIYRNILSSMCYSNYEEWETIKAERKAYWDEQERIREAKESQEQLAYDLRVNANKARIAKLSNAVKPVLTVLLYIIGAALLAGIGFLLYKIVLFFASISHKAYIEWGTVFAIAIGITAAFFAFCAFIVYIVKILKTKDAIWCKVGCGTKKIFNPLVIGIVFIVERVFIPFFSVIVSFFALLIQMFKDQCPAIQWKDNDSN